MDKLERAWLKFLAMDTALAEAVVNGMPRDVAVKQSERVNAVWDEYLVLAYADIRRWASV